MAKLAAGALLISGGVAQPAPFDCNFSTSYPRQYVAYKVDHDLVLDGSLTDPAWQEVGFTTSFADISTATLPRFDTRVKLRWDDTFLYVGAQIQDTAVWANISSTCHCIDPDQDQVIFHDNDFEIFCSPDGSNHYYKEHETNAHNATWTLCLNKPYDDGGSENSTRVLGPAGWDMQPPLHSAVAVHGRLNDPGTPASGWSVEVALPLASLAYNTTATVPPDAGSFWRINFSRVEWAVKVVNGAYIKQPSCQSCPVPGAPNEDNWVWSPQGSIAMHLPERWGMLQFSAEAVNSTAPATNQEWPIRQSAMGIYYAQHAYAAAHGGLYTANVTALLPYVAYPLADARVIDGSCASRPPQIATSADLKAFNATVWDAQGFYTAIVREDRLLRVREVQREGA